MRDDMHEQDGLDPETAADIAEGVAASAQMSAEEAEALMVTLTRCQQELAEAKNAYLRAHADFDNFRKRMRTERDQEFSRGADRVLADLLPVVDDFERALASVNEKTTVATLQQGIALIARQLQGLLERYAITPMAAEGQPFDPKYHDAVARVTTSSAPEHTVLSEIQRGYLKNGDVFRPAKVAVAMSPDEPLPE